MTFYEQENLYGLISFVKAYTNKYAIGFVYSPLLNE